MTIRRLNSAVRVSCLWGLMVPVFCACRPGEGGGNTSQRGAGKPGGGAGAVAKLVVISPHNENIQNEYAGRFSAHHTERFGTAVDVEWRDVGGGTSTILQYLRNVYARADTAEIDVLWGGGEAAFQILAADGILAPMTLPADTVAAIPEEFGGIRMVDPELRWCGSAVSGFGFVYNRHLLKLRGVKPPETWEDLANPELSGLLALADPSQSGSAAAAYEMIVQSEPTWPQGWAKLLGVLANAKRFYDSAGDAANAPVLGEAAVATCIDFYGALRVARAPDMLAYVSPKGQTAFSPDPIAILKNPPHPNVAQHFVEFVLSPAGQVLWALPPGAPGGPQRNPLGRQPVRKDVYVTHGDDFLPWIINPYATGGELVMDMELKRVRDPVLKHLVRTAAIDNRDDLRAAWAKVLQAADGAALRAKLCRLPENVATIETLTATSARLSDPTEAERIITDWQQFFRDSYRQIDR